MGFKVFDSICKNCLLTKNRIVSPERMKGIIEDCKKEQSFFICHNSPEGEEICCKKFYTQLGHVSQLIRIAERLDMVEFIPQIDKEKLPTYIEMSTRQKK